MQCLVMNAQCVVMNAQCFVMSLSGTWYGLSYLTFENVHARTRNCSWCVCRSVGVVGSLAFQNLFVFLRSFNSAGVYARYIVGDVSMSLE